MRKFKNILITGAYGFIGSNFVNLLLKHHSKDFNELILYDKMTYAANENNIKHPDHPQIHKLIDDIINIEKWKKMIHYDYMEKIDCIVNFAAESHVDNSIKNADAFIISNVLGVQKLLDFARELDALFIQISTDEVYGSIPQDKPATEESHLYPGNPYSASKAAAEHLCLAHLNTYGTKVIITRSSNNYGLYQHSEKFIPKCISNALQRKLIPVYGDGQNVRQWIHVEDNCKGIWEVMKHGKIGEIYNIADMNGYRKNIDVTKRILELADESEILITYVKDRLGHDRCYSISCDKIQNEIEWSPKISFEEGIEKLVNEYKTEFRSRK